MEQASGLTLGAAAPDAGDATVGQAGAEGDGQGRAG
jgi:hypothetical protein